MKLILDTNLLLLYLVGYYDRKFISKCKITQEFTEEDFMKIKNIIKEHKELVITPQILAELSNLSEKISEPKFSQYMQSLINKLKTFNEKYIKMTQLLNDEKNLIKLGFTDLSILEVSKKYDCLILTKDFKFSQIANYEGCKVINYNHLL